MTAHLQNKPHVVYRCYSADGALLYVGFTHDLRGRLWQHRTEGRHGWISLTTRVTWEAAGDRAAARLREREVIQAERPIWNVQGTGRNARAGLHGIHEISEHVPPYVPRHAAEDVA